MKSKKDFNFFWKWKKSCGTSIFSGNGKIIRRINFFWKWKNHSKNQFFLEMEKIIRRINFFWKWKKSFEESIFSGNGKNHSKNHPIFLLAALA
jgi:hypothetical protein